MYIRAFGASKTYEL